MDSSKRSRKTQEVHAEQLLKISTSLLTAFFVGMLIVPMTAIVSAAFSGKVNGSLWEFLGSLFYSWHGVAFILAELGVYLMVVRTQDRAYAIYDRLYPDGGKEE